MRISTSQIYDYGSRSINDAQSSLYKTQNQLSTGKKFLSAQDDPVAAAQVMLDTQAKAVNSQYADNQSNASSQLALEESQLQAVVKALQDAREQVVNAGNGSYSDAEREYIADALQSHFDTLLGLANSTDANGYYLFSGYQGNTRPFDQQADGAVSYVGDNGQRLLQVGSDRQIAVSDSGFDIFERIKTGNGTYSAAASQSNTGTGIIDAGSLVDAKSWSGHSYQIEFSSATEYTITEQDMSTSPPTTTTVAGSPFTYSAGTAITAIAGVSFSISGTPETGDAFTIEPSTNQNVFTTLKNLITAIRTDVSGDSAAGAALRNTLSIEMKNIDQALANVSDIRSTVGTRMSELESLQSVSSALDLHYEEKISNLSDLDYAEALTRFAKQQMQLEAAQNSFAKISGLSLFNYL